MICQISIEPRQKVFLLKEKFNKDKIKFTFYFLVCAKHANNEMTLTILETSNPDLDVDKCILYHCK